MTAYRYFARYKKQIFAPTEWSLDVVKGIKALFCDMMDEAMTIADAENIVLWTQLYSILKEQNAKWNAIVEIAKRKYGSCPIYRNTIIDFCKDSMPEIQMAEKGVFK